MESDEDDRGTGGRTRYSAEAFENLRDSERDRFFLDVTDEMAADSEAGGDSEADDFFDSVRLPANVKTSTPVTLPSTSRETIQDIGEIFIDSDDTDDDPTYHPNEANKRKPWNMPCRKTLFDLMSEGSDASDQSEVDEAEPNLARRSKSPSLSQASKKRKTTTQKNKDTCPFNKNKCEPKAFNNFVFDQPMGPTTQIDIASPITIFMILLGPFLKKIVDESNLFAVQKNSTLDLTEEELLAFFGVLIAMGLHGLPSMRLFWSSDPLFHVEYIAQTMSQRRFLRILRYLHVNDNTKMPKREDPNFDRMYKLRPMIDYLNTKYKEVFNPSRYLSIDESMIGFKGRSALKQYLPNKPTKRGFKVWVLACSVTGFMVFFDIYEGKKEVRGKEETLGEHVVLGLAKAFEGFGYCLFFDRFFSSIPLLKKLLSKSLFACGTITTERKGFPKELLEPDKNLKTGQSDFANDGDISVVKWKDRGAKAVKIISNMHDPEKITEVERRNKAGEKIKVPCPEAISDYNKYMGGVDHFDHLQSTYSIINKSRKWWVKIFYFLLDSAIVNAYILYKFESKNHRNKKAMSQLLFRRKLADQLINNFSSRKQTPKGCTKGKKISGRNVNEMELSDVGLHLPIPTSCRRCARCSTKDKPKRCSIECEQCKVALCIDCFAPFHKK